MDRLLVCSKAQTNTSTSTTSSLSLSINAKSTPTPKTLCSARSYKRCASLSRLPQRRHDSTHRLSLSSRVFDVFDDERDARATETTHNNERRALGGKSRNHETAKLTLYRETPKNATRNFRPHAENIGFRAASSAAASLLCGCRWRWALLAAGCCCVARRGVLQLACWLC